MINVRYYGTSHNKLIMKYVGDNQVSLWYKNKQKNLCQIIDFACPYDQRVDNKELEKIKHYQVWHESWERYGTWKSMLYH